MSRRSSRRERSRWKNYWMRTWRNSQKRLISSRTPQCGTGSSESRFIIIRYGFCGKFVRRSGSFFSKCHLAPREIVGGQGNDTVLVHALLLHQLQQTTCGNDTPSCSTNSNRQHMVTSCTSFNDVQLVTTTTPLIATPPFP